MNRLWLAAFAFALPVGSFAQLEFTAYLHGGGKDYFLLTDLEGGAKSDWLTLGRAFRGRTLLEYDAARSALIVAHAESRETLVLRQAATRDGNATGLRVLTSEFGWFAPKQKQRGRGTGEIPLELGVTFGIELTLAGLPPKTAAELELRFETPPLPQPDDTSSTSKISRQKIYGHPQGSTPARLYHTFEQPSQLVPGSYRAVLLHQGRVLVSQDFNVSTTAPRPPSPEAAFLKPDKKP
jgi:hypothetical protein